MFRRLSLLVLGVALISVLTGCSYRSVDYVSAADIAAGYRPIGGPRASVTKQEVAYLIETGEVQRMAAANQTSKRTRVVRSVSGKRALVTEHRVHGQLAMVEVRQAIDPSSDVLSTNLRRIEYGPTGSQMFMANPWQMADVLRTIRNHSYDARPEIAMRAFRDCDGVVHPAQVIQGEQPQWSSVNAIDLTIRTELWPSSIMYFQGLRPEGRAPNGMLLNPDGRWIVADSGPSASARPAFINYRLHNALKAVAWTQLFDTRLFNAPHDAAVADIR